MKILLLTNQLAVYAGSEVQILELYRYFKAKNDVVHVYANVFGRPVVQHFAAADLIGNIDDIDVSEYDLVWSQHSLFSRLFKHKQTGKQRISESANQRISESANQRISESANQRISESANPQIDKSNFSLKIISVHLSPFEMFEMSALPYMKKLQANFVANSEETREKLSSFGIPPQQVTVSHNAAPDEFVQANTGLAQLKKIAVISNHPPTEMVEAAKLLGQNGVTVDFIGMRTTQVEITPQLIGGYDVIVTIGKTVQYALLSHKPVYCYDHFGGCGYLNHDNFEIAKHHNFSGRGFSKKNAGEIALELVSLFADSFEFAKNFNQSKDFLLSCFVEKLLANAVDTHITPDLIECIKLSVPAEEKLANLYQGHVGLEKTLVNLYQENIRLKNKLNTAGEQLRAIQGKLSQVASGLQKNEKD